MHLSSLYYSNFFINQKIKILLFDMKIHVFSRIYTFECINLNADKNDFGQY